jgi:hypothetical protein
MVLIMAEDVWLGSDQDYYTFTDFGPIRASLHRVKVAEPKRANSNRHRKPPILWGKTRSGILNRVLSTELTGSALDSSKKGEQ